MGTINLKNGLTESEITSAGFLKAPVAQSDVTNLVTALAGKVSTTDFQDFMDVLTQKDPVDGGISYFKETASPSGTAAEEGELCLCDDGKLYEFTGGAWDSGTPLSVGARYWHMFEGADSSGDSGNHDPIPYWTIYEWDGETFIETQMVFGTAAPVEEFGQYYWYNGVIVKELSSSQFTAGEVTILKNATPVLEDSELTEGDILAKTTDIPDTSTMLKSDASVDGAQTLNTPQVFQNHIQVGYTDPDLAITSLLHLDNDYSDFGGHTWTASGLAVLSSTQKKFGTKSLYFSGTGDRIESTSADYVIGTNYFTFDLWIRRTTGSPLQPWAIGTPGGSGVWLRFDSSMLLLVENGVTKASGSVSYTNETWAHIAIVGEKTKISVYFNGTLKCSYVTTYNLAYDKISIGAAGQNFWGYYDEVRFINGVAKWTEDFTPPTQAYTTAFVGGKVLFHSPDSSSTIELTYSDVVALKALL